MIAGFAVAVTAPGPDPPLHEPARAAGPPLGLPEGAPAPVRCRPRGETVRFHGPTTRKRVALTFDDGPTTLTPRVLDVLAKHDAHATFFVIGRQIAALDDVIRRALQEGHAIGNHTFNHRDVGAGGKLAKDEIRPTTDLLSAVTGTRPCLFRPPYGSVGPELAKEVERGGMLLIRWNVDTEDNAGATPEVIRERALAGVSPGAIIIMHDGGPGAANTLAALPGILREIEKRGYEAVTVPTLLDLDADSR